MDKTRLNPDFEKFPAALEIAQNYYWIITWLGVEVAPFLKKNVWRSLSTRFWVPLETFGKFERKCPND